jgi:ATP-dependent exoDNAse (exonuclease V) beta subunit
VRLQLNDEQRAVVEGPRGLFVSAAAGSGKTRVLTARFLAAVLGERSETPAAMDEVLTVTFTDKAAGEIAERVRGALLLEDKQALARRADEAWISTIHSLCSRILRRHAFDAHLDPRFTVCTEVEAAVLSEQALEQVARELMRSDSALERLVVDLGASAVAGMVRVAYDQVRSLGHHTWALVLPELAGAAALGDLARRLSDVAEELRALPSTATIDGNIESIGRAASALGSLAAHVTPGLAELALEELGSTKLPRRGSADAKALAEAGLAIVDTARELAATVAVAPSAQALRTLLVAFERRFDELKDARGMLDFEDLQIRTAELLEGRPDIAAAYRSRFAEVMIDEFQDTNALQMRIIRVLGDGDVLTVGDDKQSIYRFRHADVGVFRRRAAEVAEQRQLRANYRSHPEVLAFANELFDSPGFFAEDFTRLEALGTPSPAGWPEGEPRVRLLAFDSADLRAQESRSAEALALARHLRTLHDRGVPQRDMVVLLRAMQGRAEIYAAALRDEGLDVYVASGGTYFDRPEVGDVLALLRVLDNPRDDEALLRVLAGRLTGLTDSSLAALRAAAHRERLWPLVSGESPRAPLEAADEALLSRTVDVISRLRARRGRQRVAELVHEACELLDYDLTLFASGPEGPRAWANVLKIARLADEFEEAEPGDLAAFLAHVQAQQTHGQDRPATVVAEDVEAVRIMSVHSAKGLEFPVVAVADLGSHRTYQAPDALLGRTEPPLLALRLPKALSPTGVAECTPEHRAIADGEREADEDEAKRLFYVACTRAMRALILCGGAALAKDPEGPSMLDRLRRQLAVSGSGVPAVAGEYQTALEGVPVAVTVCPAPEAAESLVSPRVRPARLVSLDSLDAGGVDMPQRLVPQRISYSGLALYRRCGYRFYAESVAGLRAPSVRASAGADSGAFGTAVHAALQRWNGAAPLDVGDERLRRLLVASGVGDDSLARLRHALECFCATPVAGEVARADRMQNECPIMLPVGASMLVGSIDLITWFGSRALIVDYKTGGGDLDADAARARYALQAGCYALAALAAGATEVGVVFVEVEREGRETRFAFSGPDAPALRGPIDDALEEMAAGRFPSLAEYDPRVCAECPALGATCPITPPGGPAA